MSVVKVDIINAEKYKENPYFINFEAFSQVNSRVFAKKMLRLNNWCDIVTPGHQKRGSIERDTLNTFSKQDLSANANVP